MSISVFGVALALFWTAPEPVQAQTEGGAGVADGRCYELRTYTAAEGKLDDLNRRFRKYSRIVFARYRMARLGFWIPLDNPENHFTYILSYADCEDRDPAWEQFRADSLWQRVTKITTHEGELVTNVESTLLRPTDYSPLR